MFRPWRLALIGLLLLGPVAGRAQPVVALYEVRAAGLPVMQVDATFDLGGARYLVRTRIRTVGVGGLFARGDQVTSAEGVWQGNDPRPQRYRVQGTWRGEPREVAIDWTAAGTPRLLTLVPPNEADREAVPETLTLATTDALSALAKLARTVTVTGRCNATAAVYDGRRRADYVVQSESTDVLPQDGAFAGEALRCGIVTRLLAGRRGDQDPGEAARPQPATAWLARPAAGLPAIPVRVELPSRWFGTIRVVLDRIVESPPQVAQQAR